MSDECVLGHRAKEQELQHVQRRWSAASQQEGSSSSEAERARAQVNALEGQLRDLHSRLTRLQADTRYSSPSAPLQGLSCLTEQAEVRCSYSEGSAGLQACHDEQILRFMCVRHAL